MDGAPKLEFRIPRRKSDFRVPRWAKIYLPLGLLALGIAGLAVMLLRILVLESGARYYPNRVLSDGCTVFGIIFGLLGVVQYLLRRKHRDPEQACAMAVTCWNFGALLVASGCWIMATEYAIVSPHGFICCADWQSTQMEFDDIESFHLGGTWTTSTYRVSSFGRDLVSTESSTAFYCRTSRGETVDLPDSLRLRGPWGHISRIAAERGIEMDGFR